MKFCQVKESRSMRLLGTLRKIARVPGSQLVTDLWGEAPTRPNDPEQPWNNWWVAGLNRLWQIYRLSTALLGAEMLIADASILVTEPEKKQTTTPQLDQVPEETRGAYHTPMSYA